MVSPWVGRSVDPPPGSYHKVLTVQTDPSPLSGQTSGDILTRMKPRIDALPLPHGYRIEWGGDAGDSSEAQQGLFTTLPLGYLVMFIINGADVPVR